MIHPLLMAIKKAPKSLFVVSESQSYSYKESITEIKPYYHELISIKENRIAVISKNSKVLIFFLLATTITKKEVLLLNPKLSKIEVENQLSILGIKNIYTDKNYYLDNRYIQKNIYNINKDNNINIKFKKIKAQDFPFIIFTSGTNGIPKAVAIKWENIFNSVQSLKIIVNSLAGDNWLLNLPIYHIAGLMIIFRTIYNQKTLTIINNLKTNKVLEISNKYNVNILSLVPTILEEIIYHIPKNKFRFILLGGAKTSSSLLKKIKEKKLKIIKTYGMTETTSQISLLEHKYLYSKLESVGKATPNNEIRIINKDKNGIGEIEVRGKSVFSNYLNDKIEKSEDWFNTKDMGYFDNDGFLYIVNRRTDLIISGGENIYPQEIEDVINKFFKEEISICAKKYDSYWGEVPIVYIKNKKNELFKEKLIIYLRSNLAKFKIPKEIIFLDDFPRNNLGKILRYKLNK